MVFVEKAMHTWCSDSKFYILGKKSAGKSYILKFCEQKRKKGLPHN